MLTISTSVLANNLKFNIEEIDSISLKDKSVIVEDLNLKLQFRSGMKINTRAMAIKKGGDMGGG